MTKLLKKKCNKLLHLIAIWSEQIASFRKANIVFEVMRKNLYFLIYSENGIIDTLKEIFILLPLFNLD